MGITCACCKSRKEIDSSYLISDKYCYLCNTRFETKILYDYHKYNCDQTALRGGL